MTPLAQQRRVATRLFGGRQRRVADRLDVRGEQARPGISARRLRGGVVEPIEVGGVGVLLEGTAREQTPVEQGLGILDVLAAQAHLGEQHAVGLSVGPHPSRRSEHFGAHDAEDRVAEPHVAQHVREPLVGRRLLEVQVVGMDPELVAVGVDVDRLRVAQHDVRAFVEHGRRPQEVVAGVQVVVRRGLEVDAACAGDQCVPVPAEPVVRLAADVPDAMHRVPRTPGRSPRCDPSNRCR